ncbi:hypothetical protein CMO93_05765 [Candidatus Woesearchaeota archaeon]|nr:hypothetical protein [Candidatus Woesearchaeota archaeon]
MYKWFTDEIIPDTNYLIVDEDGFTESGDGIRLEEHSSQLKEGEGPTRVFLVHPDKEPVGAKWIKQTDGEFTEETIFTQGPGKVYNGNEFRIDKNGDIYTPLRSKINPYILNKVQFRLLFNGHTEITIYPDPVTTLDYAAEAASPDLSNIISEALAKDDRAKVMIVPAPPKNIYFLLENN